MSSKFELKLVIERATQKVVFAVVGKDVVDFLLSLFSLSMGSMINLITKDSSIGSLGNMYISWGQLDDKFLCSSKMKANCLIPAIASASSRGDSSNFASIIASSSPATITDKLYRCSHSNCQSYFTDVSGTSCKNCFNNRMINQAGYKYAGPNVTKEEIKNGYVKSGLTYAVMDDLSMVPLAAPLDVISLLNKIGHNNCSQLEQKIVTMDVQAEGLELLKTSLWSKNVLTDVFLAKEKAGLKNKK